VDEAGDFFLRGPDRKKQGAIIMPACRDEKMASLGKGVP
jgi:hypothetical protein